MKRKEAREKGRKKEKLPKPLFSIIKMVSFFDLQLKEKGQARCQSSRNESGHSLSKPGLCCPSHSHWETWGNLLRFSKGLRPYP